MVRRNFIPCSVAGCHKPLLANGLCDKHRYRWRKYGSTDLPKQPTPIERFWSKVNKNGPVHPTLGQCWDWTAGKNRRGYGAFSYGFSRNRAAHRYSWEIRFGSIPDGLFVCHHCDRPCCVNPSHLFLGTYQDNIDDCISKGRQNKGEKVHNAKLTSEQVIAIRKRYQRRSPVNGCTAIAKELGVTIQAVHLAIKGKNWKHVE